MRGTVSGVTGMSSKVWPGEDAVLGGGGSVVMEVQARRGIYGILLSRHNRIVLHFSPLSLYPTLSSFPSESLRHTR